jgi:hypothetical protein
MVAEGNQNDIQALLFVVIAKRFAAAKHFHANFLKKLILN